MKRINLKNGTLGEILRVSAVKKRNTCGFTRDLLSPSLLERLIYSLS